MLEASETLQETSVESVAPKLNWWATLKEAMRGSHADYTQGSIRRAIFLLAVPMVLEVLLESVFVVTDIFFVSKLGADAVTTVGLTESMLTLVIATTLGLSIAATATVARRIGEKDADGAARAAVQMLFIGLGASAIFGGIGILFAPKLLALMGASPAIVATGSNFTRIMLGGSGVLVFLFLINAVFRGAGDGAIAMRVLWLANSINILLGPCLVFGLLFFPKFGVTGAAIATTIGRGTGALYAFSRLVRGGKHIKVARSHFVFDLALIARLLRLASSGAFQVFVGMASWILLVRLVSSFGSQAVAGYTIGVRILLFPLLLSWGLSNAAATMVGQSLGALKPERAERAVWRAGFYNMCFLGGIGLLFVIFARTIVGWFIDDPVVLNYGSNCLRTVACGFPLYGCGQVLTQSFNGAGDTRTPTRINIFVFWLWEIPLAYLLAIYSGLEVRGVFIAMTIAFSSLAVVSALIFRRGNWKMKKV